MRFLDGSGRPDEVRDGGTRAESAPTVAIRHEAFRWPTLMLGRLVDHSTIRGQC